MNALAVGGVAFLAGAIPFSNIAARLRAGVDLRDVGSGTVSGTALFEVAGFGALAVAGILDVAKGALGPVLAGSDRPVVAAVAAGLAVAGHDWSPFLHGAGGRGVSPAIGALAVLAWPGAVLLLLALAVGRLVHETALAVFVADLALVPLAAGTHGAAGALGAAAVVLPMLLKRLLGNASPALHGPRAYAERLLFDRDPRPAG
ncbi:MAG: glycerol-3-phosphate acyltransferase [Acidimicrobiia bacterium]